MTGERGKIRRYPGGRPFTKEMSRLFHGRKEDLQKLHQLVSLEPLVVLYGRSGLGKSSLINAGLMPKLELNAKNKCIQFRFNAWTEKSQKSPLGATIEKLSSEVVDTSITDKLLPRDQSLWRLIKGSQVADPDNRLILIFDQFEELFSYPEKEINAFKIAIAEVLRDQLPRRYEQMLNISISREQGLFSIEEENKLYRTLNIRILFIIRSDKMHLLDKMSDYLPTILKNNHELLALRIGGATDAIVLPASLEGDEFASHQFTYSENALSKILLFLKDDQSGLIEALQLQIVCTSFENNIIQHKWPELNESNTGDLEAIVRNYYQNKINSLKTSDDQKHAAKLLEDGLVDATRQQRLTLHESQIFDFFDVEQDLLDQLIDIHLLRRELDQGGGYNYELSHDTLVAPALAAKEVRVKVEAEEALIKQRDELRLERKKRRIAVFWFRAGLVLAALSISLAAAVYINDLEIKRQVKRNLILLSQVESENLLNNGKRIEALQKASEAFNLDSTDDVTIRLLRKLSHTPIPINVGLGKKVIHPPGAKLIVTTKQIFVPATKEVIPINADYLYFSEDGSYLLQMTLDSMRVIEDRQDGVSIRKYDGAKYILRDGTTGRVITDFPSVTFQALNSLSPSNGSAEKVNQKIDVSDKCYWAMDATKSYFLILENVHSYISNALEFELKSSSGELIARFSDFMQYAASGNPEAFELGGITTLQNNKKENILVFSNDDRIDAKKIVLYDYSGCMHEYSIRLNDWGRNPIEEFYLHGTRYAEIWHGRLPDINNLCPSFTPIDDSGNDPIEFDDAFKGFQLFETLNLIQIWIRGGVVSLWDLDELKISDYLPGNFHGFNIGNGTNYVLTKKGNEIYVWNLNGKLIDVHVGKGLYIDTPDRYVKLDVKNKFSFVDQGVSQNIDTKSDLSFGGFHEEGLIFVHTHQRMNSDDTIFTSYLRYWNGTMEIIEERQQNFLGKWINITDRIPAISIPNGIEFYHINDKEIIILKPGYNDENPYDKISFSEYLHEIFIKDNILVVITESRKVKIFHLDYNFDAKDYLASKTVRVVEE